MTTVFQITWRRMLFFRKTIILRYKYPHTRNRYFIREKESGTKAKGSQFFMDENHVMTMEVLEHQQRPEPSWKAAPLHCTEGRWRCWRCCGSRVPPNSPDSPLPHDQADPQRPVSASLCLGAFFITEGSQTCQEMHTTQKQHQPLAGLGVWVPQALTPQWDNP